MTQKIATEEIVRKMPDGRNVVVAMPGDPIPPENELYGYSEGGEVPTDNVISGTPKQKTPAAPPAPDGPTTVAELKVALDEMEVEYRKNANKATLEELYAAAKAEAEAEEKSLGEPPNDKALGVGENK